MKVKRAFLMSNLLLVMVSVLAHEIAASQFVYLGIAAVVCAAIWYYDTQGRPLVIGEFTGTVLCLGAFAISMIRSTGATGLTGVQALDIEVPAVGQFLIVFQLVYLLRAKKPRDYVWLYVVSIVHIGTAGLLMPGVGYGVFFVLYALVAVCTVAMYNAWMEAERSGGEAAETRVSKRFILSFVPLTFLLMAPVAVVFVLLPRRPYTTPLTRQVARRLGIQPVTGFSERVRLGRTGTIETNPQRVIRVKVSDPETGEPLQPSELLLRGISFDWYEISRERWDWGHSLPLLQDWSFLPRDGDTREMYAQSFPGFDSGTYRRIRCDVSLMPMRTSVLFAPFAAEKVVLSRRRAVMAYGASHLLLQRRRRPRDTHYTVVSRLHEVRPPAPNARSRPLPKAMRAAYVALPRELAPRVRALAQRIAPAATCPTDFHKARSILAYLSDAGVFSYTLQQRHTAGVEPVEDFLFIRKTGHCEYFAASMVILLRCVGVPARLVNGFKVSEYNPINGTYVVRQSHAHAWVETYLDPDGWRTFDPSVMRDAATPQPVFVRRWWRYLYDSVENLWVQHVLNFSYESQSEIYGFLARAPRAIRGLWVRATERLGALAQPSGQWGLGEILGRFAPPFRIALCLVVALLVALLLLKALPPLLGLFAAPAPPEAASRFYLRMERVLNRRGQRRPAWMTPWEFHDALAAAGWGAIAPVKTVTRIFCAVRYGQQPLRATERDAVEKALRALRAFRPRRRARARG